MMSYNPEIDQNMDKLTLSEGPQSENHLLNDQRSSGPAEARVAQYGNQPKKSLLSSSLAGERAYNNHNTANGNIPASRHQDRGVYFSIDQAQDIGNDYSNSGNIDIKRRYTDDHPEPELLASSVGKEMDGRLIPSSSTISLLSLNTHNDWENQKQYTSPKIHGSSNFTSNQQQQSQQPAQFQFLAQNNQQMPPLDRKNSGPPTSRNSITHLNQIRLQPYQRFTSPPPAVISVSAQPISPQAGQNSETNHSTLDSIPITNPYKTMIVPDSPSLDPTSVGGSPSRFWLTSQTPPRSLANSLNRNSRTYLYQLQVQPQAQSSQEHVGQNGKRNMHIGLKPNFTSEQGPGNYTTATAATMSTSLKSGQDSPSLLPVRTPSEEPPMTPLYLSRNTNTHEVTDSYFGNFAPGKDREVTNVATLIEVEEATDDAENDMEDTPI